MAFPTEYPQLKSYIRDVCFEVLRVEQMWGGKGFIGNRANRSHGYEDVEQPWMLAALWRAVGNAIIYAGVSDSEILAMYNRGVTYLANTTPIPALTDGNTKATPARPVAYCRHDAPAAAIKRFGLSPETMRLFDLFVTEPSEAKLDDAVKGTIADIKAIVQVGGWAGRKDLAALQTIASRMSVAYAQGGEPAPSDLSLLRVVLRGSSQLVSKGTTSHAAPVADTLAQAVMHFGRRDLETHLFWLFNTFAFYHQQGTNTDPVNITDPKAYSDLGARMMMYPNSETKVMGPMLDTRFCLVWQDHLEPVTSPKNSAVRAESVGEQAEGLLEESGP